MKKIKKKIIIIKKERKRKERRKNEHCGTMKIIIFLMYTSYNCLLCCYTTVYVCSCFLVLYLCCSQYSLMRKIQNCRVLCILCTRLVDTLTYISTESDCIAYHVGVSYSVRASHTCDSWHKCCGFIGRGTDRDL